MIRLIGRLINIGYYIVNRQYLVHYTDINFNTFATIMILYVATVYYLRKYRSSLRFHQLINAGLAVFSINYANNTIIC